MATIRDVARAANVSVGTVSMVLNRSDKVSEVTRQRVQGVIDALDYRRNPHARSLKLNKSCSVGFLVTDLSNPFFGSMVGAMQDEVNARDNALVLGMTQNRISQERRALERLVRDGVDGLIMVPAHERNPDTSHVREQIERGMPLVFISSYYVGVECGCVMTDLARGAYLLTRHLLEQGRRRIAFVGGYRTLALAELRIQGYVKAHAEAGVPVDEALILEGDPVFEGGREAAEHLLALCPDAIMGVNDLVGMGILSLLREKRVRVPDDIAVAGYDDLLFASMLETPLTTVRQPVKQMCACAAEMLFRQIEGAPGSAQSVLLEPTLVVRASTQK